MSMKYVYVCKEEPKDGFKSDDTGEFLLLQNKYSKSLSWAENFPPKTVNNLFKFYAQWFGIFILATKKFFSIFWLKPPLRL